MQQFMTRQWTTVRFILMILTTWSVAHPLHLFFFELLSIDLSSAGTSSSSFSLNSIIGEDNLGSLFDFHLRECFDLFSGRIFAIIVFA